VFHHMSAIQAGFIFSQWAFGHNLLLLLDT